MGNLWVGSGSDTICFSLLILGKCLQILHHNFFIEALLSGNFFEEMGKSGGGRDVWLSSRTETEGTSSKTLASCIQLLVEFLLL